MKTNGNHKIKKIITLLKKKYPENKIALHFSNPLQLLIATILSAQCTDVRVNAVTSKLFKKYHSAKEFTSVQQKELEQDIKPTGFYRNKAKNIIACCQKILDTYNGTVPQTMEKLIELPGVGRKTANVVLGNIFGVPGIIVDTHVKRVSFRLGLTKNTNPEKIEVDLMKIIPRHEWTRFSNSLVFHGRETCKARTPLCCACIIRSICPKHGIGSMPK